MYTIGQVSKMFGLPISTLRYYDKEGLFPAMKRKSGIRRFSDAEIGVLRIIECLKRSGLEIKQIKQFIEWCGEGSSTYEKRHELLLAQKQHVEDEICKLQKAVDMLKFKCWYYEKAINDGGEQNLRPISEEKMPEDIRKAYRNAYN